MRVVNSVDEINGVHTKYNPNFFYIVAPNGNCIISNSDHLYGFLQGLLSLDTVDSNFSEETDIWNYSIYRTDGGTLKNFKYKNINILTVGDMIEVAKDVSYGFAENMWDLDE